MSECGGGGDDDVDGSGGELRLSVLDAHHQRLHLHLHARTHCRDLHAFHTHICAQLNARDAHRISLAYVDDERDLVTIGSTAELHAVLRNFTSSSTAAAPLTIYTLNAAPHTTSASTSSSSAASSSLRGATLLCALLAVAVALRPAPAPPSPPAPVPPSPLLLYRSGAALQRRNSSADAVCELGAAYALQRRRQRQPLAQSQVEQSHSDAELTSTILWRLAEVLWNVNSAVLVEQLASRALWYDAANEQAKFLLARVLFARAEFERACAMFVELANQSTGNAPRYLRWQERALDAMIASLGQQVELKTR